MRIANLSGRACLVAGSPGTERAIEISVASGGRFSSSFDELYDQWDQVQRWGGDLDPDAAARLGIPIDRALLGPPSPSPSQVFAIGLNYDQHAAESGFEVPADLPPTFTKYVSSFTGPDSVVELPAGGQIDWEVELVAVIGRRASAVSEAEAWSHVAGLTLGQDLSDRGSQFLGPAPQFSLAKSFAGFSPQGPWLVTPDELSDPDDVEIGCRLDGAEVQKARTRQLIFPVSALVARLSRIVTLWPGDVIFTGTPAGVGMGCTPPRFVECGSRLDSWAEGIGELHQTFVNSPTPTSRQPSE
ncbi:fumarylacetoacetate hydrolase family protein [Pseudonocardia kujensis]|uniref:fumarylacetoacetate hydrolase family protein n=1 Tax=Pseudonocardia kujensis TaxID=1128675 RepID=UPI001E2A3FEF|nr:fumarylacetoacetate hydrolase family protein [Pseudonocardia kujensis]MCE0761433.1 fumarylacetoacetate hydrolase family protein [Pseudonocardia kujensis]